MPSRVKCFTCVLFVLVPAVAFGVGPDPQAAETADQQVAPPSRPLLPDEAKAHVEELEKQIAELRERGMQGEDTRAQDSALGEAIRLAEEVLAIRLENQGSDSQLGSKWTGAAGGLAEWYEVGDARRRVVDLRHSATLELGQRAEIAQADAAGSKAEDLYGQGKYDLALPLVQAQLKTRRRLLGDEHPQVATSLNNLAALMWAKGDYAAAEPLHREALAMHRKRLGDEHPDVASSLNSLAVLLHAKGDYAAAEPHYREALALLRKLLGDQHPDVALSLNNLAVLLEAKGDYTAAEPLHREALAMRRKLLGEEHPDVAMSLNNLAGLLYSKGDYAAAEPLHREALAMRRKLLGDEHPRVASSLNNLANFLESKGDYAAAEPLYREALAMGLPLDSGGQAASACQKASHSSR